MSQTLRNEIRCIRNTLDNPALPEKMVKPLEKLAERLEIAVEIQEKAVMKARDALDAARKTFGFYVQEHRKKGSDHAKIKRNVDARDLCEAAEKALAGL